MLKIINEFKTFIARGNALDLAVWIIIGAAFWKIVNSLVDDIIMPPIGVIIWGVDFSELKLVLKNAVVEWDAILTPAVTLNYWLFINNIVNFLIIMFSIFMMLKIINNIFRKEEKKEWKKVSPTKDQELLTEIRDLLKNK